MSRNLLLAVGVAGSLLLTGCGGGSSSRGGGPEPYTAIGPILLSKPELEQEAKILHQPLYWAGPMQGDHYEFTRSTLGSLFVRYLPQGVLAGAPRAKYLVVGTYRFPDAYDALKKLAKSKAIAGPGGSVVYVRPKDPKSVLIAFPGVADEIEIYDPQPSVALAAAESGQLKLVRR